MDSKKLEKNQITASDDCRLAFELPVVAANLMDGCFCLLFLSKFVPIVDQGIFTFVGATDFKIHFAHKCLWK